MIQGRRIMLSIAVAAIAAVVLMNKLACNSSGRKLTNNGKSYPVKSKFIIPFSEGLDVPFTFFTITAGRDTQLVFSSGTKINIPGDAFLLNNKILKGEKVKIAYREIQNGNEIIQSGIPMKVSPNGDEYLKTTGMMEFRAFLDKQELSANKNAQVRFDMMNSEVGKDVNLYYLDQSKEAWVEKSKDLKAKVITTNRSNKSKTSDVQLKKEAIKNGYIIPVTPREKNDNKFNFHFKIDVQKYPEISVYEGIEWEYAGTGGKDNPKKNPWVETTSWTSMELDATNTFGIYRLTLSGGGKTFITTVRPVFDPMDMKYAQSVFQVKMKKHKEYIAKRKEEIKKAEQTAARKKRQNALEDKASDIISRSFAIDNFGIWNCDILYRIENPALFTLNFTTQNDTVQVTRMYMFEKGIKSVITFHPTDNKISDFKCGRDKEYTLLLMDSEARIYKRSIYIAPGTSIVPTTFVLKEQGANIKSINDLSKITEFI